MKHKKTHYNKNNPEEELFENVKLFLIENIPLKNDHLDPLQWFLFINEKIYIPYGTTNLNGYDLIKFKSNDDKINLAYGDLSDLNNYRTEYLPLLFFDKLKGFFPIGTFNDPSNNCKLTYLGRYRINKASTEGEFYNFSNPGITYHPNFSNWLKFHKLKYNKSAITNYLFLYIVNDQLDENYRLLAICFLLFLDTTTTFKLVTSPIVILELYNKHIITKDTMLYLFNKWMNKTVYNDGIIFLSNYYESGREKYFEKICSSCIEIYSLLNDSINDFIVVINKFKNDLALKFDNDTLALCYRQLGIDYKRQGKYHCSLNAYKSALNIPNNFNDHIYLNIGTSLNYLSKYDEAIEVFSKIHSNNIDINYLKNYKLARLYYDRCDLVASLKYFEIALHENPQNLNGDISKYINDVSSYYYYSFLMYSILYELNITNKNISVNDQELNEFLEYDEFKDKEFLFKIKDTIRNYLKTKDSNYIKTFLTYTSTLKSKLILNADIPIWLFLIDNKYIYDSEILDIIVERINNILTILSLTNNSEEYRLQIKHKYYSLILAIIHYYIDQFNDPIKALALYEMYNCFVFKCNLEYLKNSDLINIREKLIEITRKLYIDPNDENIKESMRKSFIELNENEIDHYNSIFNEYFKISSQLNLSLKNFQDYVNHIKRIINDIGCKDLIIHIIWEDDIYGLFLLMQNCIKFIYLDKLAYENIVIRFTDEINSILSNFNFNDNSVKSILDNLSQLFLNDLNNNGISIINYERLSIIPSGITHHLPFHALSHGGEYIINKCDINYLHNLICHRETTKNIVNYVLIGNPECNDPTRELLNTEKEIEHIASTIEQTDKNIEIIKLIRNYATKDNVLRSINPHSNIHFACHAKYVDDHPMLSMINLSSTEDDPNNLSAGELYGLDLSKSDFIFLSACETGKGKILSGNESLGLPRGFLTAGTKNVICTMWELWDEYAPIITNKYYEKYIETNDPINSYSAMINFAIDTNIPIFAWAPFKLIAAEYYRTSVYK